MPFRTPFQQAVVASLVLTLLGGSAVGLYILLAPLAGIPVQQSMTLGRLHGQMQLVGFVALLVAAVGLELVPRSRAAAPVPARWARLVVGGILLGVLLRVLGLASAGAALVTAAALSYAFLTLRALATGRTSGRPDDAPLAAAIVWLPLGAGLELASTLDPMTAGVTHTASIAAILYGAIGGHILAFAVRLAPAFANMQVPSGRVVIASAVLWNAAVLLTSAGYQLAWLGAAAAWALAAGAMDVSGRRRPILSEAPLHAVVARWAFRATFAWAIVFSGVAVLFTETQARHAFAFGVVLSVLFGVGARLIPALAGGRAASPTNTLAALALVSAAAALRLLAELMVLPYAVAAAASGILAYLALLVFGYAILRAISVQRTTAPARA
ncbi:MAG TPA: hypothetical protein VFM93_11915 [Candidatus Limnocylindria bacterium]|nr:hypothetical protein [Candidatus Limnocylindria bacterium]